MLLLEPQSVDQRRESGGLLPPARVVQKESRERWAPVFEHAHEGSARKVWPSLFLRHEREADAIDRRAREKAAVVRLDTWRLNGWTT